MPNTHRLLRLTAFLALAGALAACENPNDDDDGPVPGEDLVFLRPAPNAPHLETYDTSFVATRGEDAELRIDYVNGEECLRLRLDDETLLRRPDGTAIQEGESVTIRVRVVDAGYFNFEFSPAGLRFDPDEPAELRVDYGFAHPDYNGDGEVDDDDEDFDFGWWRQEMPGQAWERIGSARVHDLTEVRADLEGFTRYALAGGN